MLCILEMDDGEIKGWLIARDMHDARRRTYDANLAQTLYRMEFVPPPGRYGLGDGYIMLVD